jgi:flavin reductase (DIM6/NTAB) family NADH-FMN oxidoreductase RutF
MSIDPGAFKSALTLWPSGVTVVTTVHQGQWKGMTASSFSSVSLEPPLVLVCVARKLLTHQMLSDSGVFAVNILSGAQIDQGKLFAGMMPEIEDRFALGNWGQALTGSPTLLTALAWLDCRVAHAYDGGDHTIFVGEVLAVGTPEPAEVPPVPLVYYNRAWGRFTRSE